jgi:hypothetical protein
MFSIVFKKIRNKMTLKKLAVGGFFLSGKYSKFDFIREALGDEGSTREGGICHRKNNLQMRMVECDGRSLSIFAGEGGWVEELLFAALDQSWMTFSAEEETVWVVGVDESWEGPEASLERLWIDLGWAVEADDGAWVALFSQEIGPVAAVDFLVVGQAFGAFFLVWNSIFALDVVL